MQVTFLHVWCCSHPTTSNHSTEVNKKWKQRKICTAPWCLQPRPCLTAPGPTCLWAENKVPRWTTVCPPTCTAPSHITCSHTATFCTCVSLHVDNHCYDFLLHWWRLDIQTSNDVLGDFIRLVQCITDLCNSAVAPDQFSQDLKLYLFAWCQHFTDNASEGVLQNCATKTDISM